MSGAPDADPEPLPAPGPAPAPAAGTGAAAEAEDTSGLRWIVRLLGAVWAVALARELWRSLHWPIVGDGPIMEYVAWMIRDGAVPYRDVFDMNFPGTYLIHVAGQSLGLGPVRYQVLGALSLVVAMVVVGHVLKPFGGPARAVAALLVATFYLRAGPWMSLQRDWLVGVLEIAAVGLVLGEGRSRWRSLGAGFLLGYAVTIKPQALLVAGLVPVLMAVDDGLDRRARRRAPRDDLRRLARAVVPVGVGAVLAVSLVMAWVAATGGLSSMAWIVGTYLPSYSRLDGFGFELGSTPEALARSLRTSLGKVHITGLALAVPALLWIKRPLRQQRRVRVLALLAAAGLVHLVTGVKNWEYHEWPFLLAALALVGVAFGDVADRVRGTSVARRRVLPGLTAVALAALGLLALTGRGDRLFALPARVTGGRVAASWIMVGLALPLAGTLLLALVGDERIRERLGRTVAPLVLVASLAAVLLGIHLHPAPDEGPDLGAIEQVLLAESQPGDRVQVLDTTEGAKAVALRARLPSATRFVYDFHFFHDVGSPVNEELRAELIRSFDEAQPRFVIVSGSSWSHRRSFAALADFPELEDRLRAYSVLYDDGDLRLLRRS